MDRPELSIQDASRRSQLTSAACLAGASMAASALPALAQREEDAGATVTTRDGKLLGARRDGIHSFKGIPYGASTGGANRFLPPQPVMPWSGTREALAHGPRAPQNERTADQPHLTWIRDTRPTSEDCLVLNVFTPGVNDNIKRPVMVYIHGGGFISGASSAAGLDGTNLAKRGDVVVVSMNHRLNTFGYTYLGDFDARFADSGNAGMLDLVAALQWVRDNIGVFGGDAGNVTIFGQSGGASKVAVLMAMPAAKGLFHKAIVQSASSLLRMATREKAAASAAGLLAQLQIDRSRPEALQAVPPEQLMKAMSASIVASRKDNFRPVVDGRSLSVHPFEPAAPALSASVPLMIGTCETEVSFDFSLNPKNFSLTVDEALARVKLLLDVNDVDARRLLDAYSQTHPGATPSDLVIYIFTDHKYRLNDIRAAERKTQQGGAPAYMYLFTWKTPVLDGRLKTPHTLCIPFVFGNVDIASGITGTGPERYPLMQRVMDAWIAFARSGNPGHAGLPTWRPYSVSERATMIFDNECRLNNDPNDRDRAIMNEFPAFVADAAGRR